MEGGFLTNGFEEYPIGSTYELLIYPEGEAGSRLVVPFDEYIHVSPPVGLNSKFKSMNRGRERTGVGTVARLDEVEHAADGRQSAPGRGSST